MTYIWHVTLNSGHALKQPRSAVGDDAIAALADMLDAVLAGGHPEVPGFKGYVVNGNYSGHDLISTLWAAPWSNRVPILTTAISLKSRSSPALWRMMHEQSTVALRTEADKPPAAPWLADRLEAGAVLHADALAWSGDFSRCLAWAWAEYRGGV